MYFDSRVDYMNNEVRNVQCLQMDPDHDRKISDHVLRMHRYRTPGEQDGDGKPANTIKPCSHCISYPQGIQPLGGPRTCFTPTGTPAHFHTVSLFHRVPVAHFKNTPGFYHLPLLQSRGGYSPGYAHLLGQTRGKAIIV